jgi:WD40 repeat protein
VAWTSVRTWTVNDVATAALLNTHIRDNLNFLHDPPGASWSITNATTISVASSGSISAFTGPGGNAGTVELWDTDTMHSTVTNSGRMTVNTAGVYRIVGNGQWTANAAGTVRRLAVLWNSTTHTAVLCQNANNVTVEQCITATINAQASDIFELGGAQTSGGALTLGSVTNTGVHPMFSCCWVGNG